MISALRPKFASTNRVNRMTTESLFNEHSNDFSLAESRRLYQWERLSPNDDTRLLNHREKECKNLEPPTHKGNEKYGINK